MKSRKQEYIWLLKATNKNISNNISYTNSKKNISPNRFRIKIGKIVMITTEAVEKNYCKVILTKNKVYFADRSMTQLIQKLKRMNKFFFRISKSTYVSLDKFCSRLDFRYLISKHLEKAVKVGDTYMDILKNYFENTG